MACVHPSPVLQVDDHVWVEVKNFIKCLIQMFSSRGQQCIFMETAMHVCNRDGGVWEGWRGCGCEACYQGIVSSFVQEFHLVCLKLQSKEEKRRDTIRGLNPTLPSTSLHL